MRYHDLKIKGEQYDIALLFYIFNLLGNIAYVLKNFALAPHCAIP